MKNIQPTTSRKRLLLAFIAILAIGGAQASLGSEKGDAGSSKEVAKTQCVSPPLLPAHGFIQLFFNPSRRGRVAAKADIARGHFKIQAFGIPSPESGKYQTLLKERYGVEMCFAAGCVVSQREVAYLIAYNEVVMKHLNTKYGKDIFTECAEAAGLK